MTILVDTGVLYADHDTDAARHDAASEALEAVYDGEFGHPYVSDYIECSNNRKRGPRSRSRVERGRHDPPERE